MSDVLYREIGREYPLAVQAAGLYITDHQGKSYLDMSGGAAVSCLGHKHPNVINALHSQIDQVAFAHTSFFSNEPQEALASALTSLFGEAGAKVYFSAGGSEANETALKLAWQYWQAVGQPEKKKIISRHHSYHGNTFGALSVSGNTARRAKMKGLLMDWPRIDACYPYRHQHAGETEVDYGIRAAQALEDAIIKAGADTVAAFIAEPVVGASLGVVPAPKGYFKHIRKICAKYDVLFIADEVMCGAGRTGYYFAHTYENIMPDIVTLAKGLGGGYQPLAATIAGKKVADAFCQGQQNFDHGHTYVGHATTCAAGLAVVNTIIQDDLLPQIQQKGEEFQELLSDRLLHHPNVGDIRGRGLFRGIELVANKETKRPVDNGVRMAGAIKELAMEKGMVCYPGAGSQQEGLSCHILLAPAYIINHNHMDECVDKLDSILKEIFGA